MGCTIVRCYVSITLLVWQRLLRLSFVGRVNSVASPGFRGTCSPWFPWPPPSVMPLPKSGNQHVSMHKLYIHTIKGSCYDIFSLYAFLLNFSKVLYQTVWTCLVSIDLFVMEGQGGIPEQNVMHFFSVIASCEHVTLLRCDL